MCECISMNRVYKPLNDRVAEPVQATVTAQLYVPQYDIFIDDDITVHDYFTVTSLPSDSFFENDYNEARTALTAEELFLLWKDMKKRERKLYAHLGISKDYSFEYHRLGSNVDGTADINDYYTPIKIYRRKDFVHYKEIAGFHYYG